ncbi:NAD(P)/FAD-dependent oxidoreductase [Clostridium grantii]|uniref:Sarcosine oxidase subunit alpha n=1 Tax=Clostridium grantii DSM 8605 TaxID=1121316 RepID=A0A1M5TGK6_9CLOT|nr:FAD-dependent oxidoreductase [Clostridium grantii]SHH49887.1 sarcosine oxidase subunit alpha [Clostridium grantii DSM 8605]
MHKYDIIVIGGGSAGMAAAIKAKEIGNKSVLIVEREDQLGGTLNQCIHSGFGVEIFGEELTGPEYVDRFIKKVKEMNIEYRLNTTILELSSNKIVTLVSPQDGVTEVKAKAIILAMGCRERPRGVLNISGSRCAGIYSAGTAQRFMNLDGYLPGKKVVIFGSGNIALRVARRMTLESAEVKAVIEELPEPKGDKKNVIGCLENFEIPLFNSYTITEIKGEQRVEGVIISKVDENLKVIEDSEKFIECDTIVLSVALTPENKLCKNSKINLSSENRAPEVNDNLETNIEGIFACGNLIYYHNSVSEISMEGYKAAENAVEYIKKLF